MCLAIIDSNKQIESGVGWKIFEVSGERVKFLYRKHGGNAIVKRGTWLHVRKYEAIQTWNVKTQKFESYAAGFHLYAKYSEAVKIAKNGKNRKVVRVKFEGCFTQGREYSYSSTPSRHVSVLVAQSIFVAKPKKVRHAK